VGTAPVVEEVVITASGSVWIAEVELELADVVVGITKDDAVRKENCGGTD
jgi:hypothetical protein